jgi:hypothetical protein
MTAMVRDAADDVSRRSATVYYGHFFCHVHQDYVVNKAKRAVALEHRMWKKRTRGAQHPAEHMLVNEAKPALISHSPKPDLQ